MYMYRYVKAGRVQASQTAKHKQNWKQICINISFGFFPHHCKALFHTLAYLFSSSWKCHKCIWIIWIVGFVLIGIKNNKKNIYINHWLTCTRCCCYCYWTWKLRKRFASIKTVDGLMLLIMTVTRNVQQIYNP